jgi:PHP domain-containing protein
MTLARWTCAGLLALAVAAGTLADRLPARSPITIGGYHVLAADFHTHSSMWSDGALTPWGLVLEAQRHGLDAIAITGHNELVDARIGRWFSSLIGGPIVLRGQEILAAPQYHLIAAGITKRVSFQQSAAAAIDDVHRQGGIAIAAHPLREFWPAFDEAAIAELDGAEVCHPIVYNSKDALADLEQFSAARSFAAIGSSDFHGLGVMGLCRTYVFATERSEQGILEAIRARRTVVHGPDGRVYGDPELIRLAAADGRPAREAAPPARGWFEWFSGLAGIVGLWGLLMSARSSDRYTAGRVRRRDHGAVERIPK